MDVYKQLLLLPAGSALAYEVEDQLHDMWNDMPQEQCILALAELEALLTEPAA